MAKISNEIVYIPNTEIEGLDYFIGTDFSDGKRTVNFRIQDLGSHYNTANGVRNLDYFFYNHISTNPRPTDGYFYSNGNEQDPNNITHFIFSKKTMSKINAIQFFDSITAINPFDLIISQKVGINSIYFFRIDSVQKISDYFKLNVSKIFYPENNSLEYTDSFAVFNIKASGISVTKTSDLINDGEDGTSFYIEDDDARLSDARTPLSHTHTESDITDLDKYTQVETDNLLGNKLDKVSTVDVEKVYIKNADGSQAMKATSDLTSEISIQNQTGVEQFKVTDSVKFEGVSFSALDKKIRIDPLVPLSAFLDPINGSDVNGVLENANRPFKTINALLNNLPATTGETYTIYITGGTISVTRKIEMRNLKFIAYTATTFDFTNCMENDGVTHAKFCLEYNNVVSTWYFENENISILNTYVGQKQLYSSTEHSLIFKGYLSILNWKPTGVGAFTASGVWLNNASNITINKLLDSAQARTNLNFKNGTIKIVINEFISSRKNAIYADGSITCDVEIKKITEGSASAIPLTIGSRGKLKLGDVNINGKINIYTTEINFNGTLSSGCTINTNSDIIRGTVFSTTYITNEYNNKIQRFENFTGKLNGLVSVDHYFVFNNCVIETYDYLIHKFTDKQDVLFFEGFNSIKQNVLTNLARNHGFTPAVNQDVIINDSGQLSTNMKSFGANVTYVKNTATFKEKLNEIVIRSKKDIVNKVLSSSTNYIIDGAIDDIIATDRIIVPVGGLSLSGYGFDVSSLKATQNNSVLFESPVGGCGNLFLSNISLEASGTGSKVFNLTNAGAPTGGADAIELNVVNFDNCTSLGELTNFRQGLWDNIGVFGCKDGLTLSGTWSGGFRSDLVIVRNFGIASTISTLFKKGTDLVFQSRFLTDINADFKVGGLFSNFDIGSFSANKLFQIKGAILTRNKVIDSTDNYTDTLNVNSSVCDWFGNIGLPNAGQKSYSINEYDADYSSTYTDRSLVDKQYTDSVKQETITTSRSALPEDNGCLIKIKGNATYTIDQSTLPTGWNVIVRSFTGATGTFVASAGTTFDAPTGLILKPLKMCSIIKDSDDNKILINGETSLT